MTHRLIIILFSSFICWTYSFGQVNPNDSLANCRGFLITPASHYKEVHDIDFRRSERTFDKTDSSLNFITDNTCEVIAACAGKVISIEPDKDNSYFLITRAGDCYAVYSRLTKPIVKVGDKVQAGQKLAKLTKWHNETDYELDFAMYKVDADSNIHCLNVSKWLKL